MSVRSRVIRYDKARTKFLAERLELVKVRLILLFVLNLLLNTLEDADSSRVVVNATGGTDSGFDDGGGRDKVVGETVVEAALDLEEILSRLEEVDVALREGLKRLLAV